MMQVMKRMVLSAAPVIVVLSAVSGHVKAERIAWVEADGSQPAAVPGLQAAVWPPGPLVSEPATVPVPVWGLLFMGEVEGDDFQVLRGIQ